jgi:hypothetical protein
MLRNDVHPKVVADKLGHRSTRMTLDVYRHVVPALEARAAQTVCCFGAGTWLAFGFGATRQHPRKTPQKIAA